MSQHTDDESVHEILVLKFIYFKGKNWGKRFCPSILTLVLCALKNCLIETVDFYYLHHVLDAKVIFNYVLLSRFSCRYIEQRNYLSGPLV